MKESSRLVNGADGDLFSLNHGDRRAKFYLVLRVVYQVCLGSLRVVYIYIYISLLVVVLQSYKLNQ